TTDYRSKTTRNKDTTLDTATSGASTAATSGETKESTSDEEAVSDATSNVETSYVTTEATNDSYTDSSLTTSKEYNTTTDYRSKATRNKDTRPNTATSDGSTAVARDRKNDVKEEEVGHRER